MSVSHHCTSEREREKEKEKARIHQTIIACKSKLSIELEIDFVPLRIVTAAVSRRVMAAIMSLIGSHSAKLNNLNKNELTHTAMHTHYMLARYYSTLLSMYQYGSTVCAVTMRCVIFTKDAERERERMSDMVGRLEPTHSIGKSLTHSVCLCVESLFLLFPLASGNTEVFA